MTGDPEISSEQQAIAIKAILKNAIDEMDAEDLVPALSSNKQPATIET